MEEAENFYALDNRFLQLVEGEGMLEGHETLKYIFLNFNRDISVGHCRR